MLRGGSFKRHHLALYYSVVPFKCSFLNFAVSLWTQVYYFYFVLCILTMSQVFIQVTLLLPKDALSNTMFDLLDYFQCFANSTNISMNILSKYFLHTKDVFPIRNCHTENCWCKRYELRTKFWHIYFYYQFHKVFNPYSIPLTWKRNLESDSCGFKSQH